MLKMKKGLALGLAVASCLSIGASAVGVNNQTNLHNNSISFLQEDSIDLKVNDQIYMKQAEVAITDIESELVAKKTNVQNELKLYIAYLEDIQSKSTDLTEYQSLSDLISSANNLLSTYQKSSTQNIVSKSPSIATETGIAAIVAYFHLNDCYLAAELLLHMSTNDKLNSYYAPGMTDAVKYNALARYIKYHSPKTSGSDAFTSDYSLDAYYAIHKFNWSRNSSGIVTITDRYDFELDGKYSGLAGTAINFLAYAQLRGELLPYYVLIRY